MIEKLSISANVFREVEISAADTNGSGLPTWLLSALIIDFSFRRLMPLTSIFSTAKIGVKIVARTRSRSEPKEIKTVSVTALRFLVATVKRLASGDNFEKKPLLV